MSPSIPSWRSLDVVEREWDRTATFSTEDPSSDAFQECAFWRCVAVVWTCATIEAFINDEGVIWLGERFYKDMFEG